MLLLCALIAGSGSAWADTKTEGFESATTTTTYNSTQTITTEKSDCGIAWSIYYGSPSTTSAITDDNSCLIRYYTADKKLGYAQTTTGIQGLTNVTFNAKVTNTGNKMGVWYSTDGTNWTALATNVTLSTSSASKSYDIPNSSSSTTYYVKIGLTTGSSTNKKDLIFDDVVFTYSTPSTPPSITANDVDIAYNATNGSIVYELKSGTGNVTAEVTDGDWLELGTITESEVPFTCSANTATTARTAQVTLSFGDEDKVVKITQAANENIAPAWSTLPEPCILASQQYKLDLTGYVTGYPAPTITLKSTTADNSEYSFVDGQLKFNPENAGEYDFTFTATNSEGSVDATLTVTVNSAPEISVPQASYSTKLGDEDVEFTVTAIGTPAPTLALSDTNAKSSDYDFDQNDGFFTFTPTAAGTFTFTFTATNDVGSVSKTVTVVVKRTASIPVFANADITYGSTYTVDKTYIEGGEITVTSGNTSVATVNGLEITPVAVGKTTITVATAENETYTAGSETFELTVTAPEGKSVMAGAENTTNVTLNKYGYTTFCSVNPMDFTSTTGYTAWRISGIEGETITFKKITGTIKGGQGVLLYNENADGVNTSNVTIKFADGTTVFTTSENKLVGTTAPTYVEADEYYGLKGNKFVKVSPAGTVPAGKALLPVSAINSSVSELMFVFDDATGIYDVRSKMAEVRGEVYDLQGRKVENPTKGLYIVNGKKVVIK